MSQALQLHLALLRLFQQVAFQLQPLLQHLLHRSVFALRPHPAHLRPEQPPNQQQPGPPQWQQGALTKEFG